MLSSYNALGKVVQLSLMQYVDNRLAQVGSGFFNTSSRLYYQADTQLNPAYVAYASPFRSWVWDSGVSGAQIGGRVSGTLSLGGTGTLNPGQSGMQVDFVNGRVLFPASVGKNAIISGSYAVKEINVYAANQSQEKTAFETKYYLNSRFARSISGIPPPYDMVLPAIFVTNTKSSNDPWALGGLYQTQQHATLVVLSETLSQLEGISQLMIDSADVVFPKIPRAAWPLDEQGWWKGGTGYNYETMKERYCWDRITVSSVQASKVGDGQRLDNGAFLGLIDLRLDVVRTIH